MMAVYPMRDFWVSTPEIGINGHERLWYTILSDCCEYVSYTQQNGAGGKDTCRRYVQYLLWELILRLGRIKTKCQ